MLKELWVNIITSLSKEDSEREVIVYCASDFGKKISRFLLNIGIPLVAFCDNSMGKKDTKINDIPVYDYVTCKHNFKAPFFIIANISLERGEKIGESLKEDYYIEGKDYFNIQKVLGEEWFISYNWHLLCENKVVIFLGQYGMSNLVLEVMKDNDIKIKEAKFCSTSYDDGCYSLEILPIDLISIEECQNAYRDATYIIVEHGGEWNKISERLENYLLRRQINHIIIYQTKELNNILSINCGEEKIKDDNPEKIHNMNDKIQTQKKSRLEIEDINRVVIIGMTSNGGMHFLKHLLDGHPECLMLSTDIQSTLWYMVQELKYVSVENMKYKLLDVIEKLEYMNSIQFYYDNLKFIEEFEKTIAHRTILTEKDIFVAMHIAGYYTIDKSTYDESENPIIVWDPHDSQLFEISMRWLDSLFDRVYICVMIRNPLIQLGAGLSWHLAVEGRLNMASGFFNPDVMFTGVVNKEFRTYKDRIYTIKFEELKISPEHILTQLCEYLDIKWNHCLLQTTELGKEAFLPHPNQSVGAVTGFDLKPVYNQYEFIFSSFDRFRLDILLSEIKKAYGYPYLKDFKDKFTKEEIKEWFQYPYEFETTDYCLCIKKATSAQKKILRSDIYHYNCMFLDMLYDKENFSEYFDFLKV